MSPDDQRHGSRAGYLAGCHDTCCRLPHLEYLKQRRALRREQYNRAQKDGRIRRERLQQTGVTTFVYPAEPVREHVQRLRDLGWSTSAIAAMHGNISDDGIAQLLRKNPRTVESKTNELLRLPYSLAVPDSVPDSAWVPSLGAARRQQALLALGWTHAAIRAAMEDLCGVSVRGYFAGQVNARRWRIFDSVYHTLGRSVGPSDRTRERARALGYVTPAGWDNIDDPDAKPIGIGRIRRPRKTEVDEMVVVRCIAGDRTVQLTKAERGEVARRLLAAGWSHARIEEHTGLKAERYLEVAA